MRESENRRQKIEVADIINSCQEEMIETLSLCGIQTKAVEDILKCRTAAAGGHISYCNHCDYNQQAYNSCRNRHCPKCQFVKQHQWIDKLTSRLMPGRYFHIVFTLPEELKTLFYINQRECYGLLFRAASEALQNAGRNPAFLSADVGALCVLHTWGQTLTYHPHVHLLVPAGGLSADGMEWVKSPKKFFVPVKALSSMFRGILVRYLQTSMGKDELKLPDGFPSFNILKDTLYSKNWHVYSKKAFGGINSVLNYLGRYTHRVAISNSRLVKLSDQEVTFRYKDNRKGQQQKLMTLTNIEFVRRFLQHILPSGLCKIRYVGILAVVHIKDKREQAISLIDKTIWLSTLEGLSVYEALRTLMGKDPAICPVCKIGLMVQSKPIDQLE